VNRTGDFQITIRTPTLPENLESLVKTVDREKADLGIAFDGDGDRIGVVDGKGRIIPADHLMMLFARDLLTRHKGAKIIGDIKCSQALFDDIRTRGGVPIMWKSGAFRHQKQNAGRRRSSGRRIERTHLF
jgi:phosphomannomutase